MINSNFVFLFIATVASLVIAEKNSSETSNSSKYQTPIVADDKGCENDSETTTKEKNTNSFQSRQRRPDNLEAQNQRRTSTPKLHKVHHSEYLDDGAAIPHLGFSLNPRQNIYLSDYTGEYDVKLQNFQREGPAKFQTALGAISTHILNQRNNQEYVPYPPNRDLCNYSAYRGNPRATEPPAVRTYERASKTNYDIQSSADFDQRNPSRLLYFEDYRRAVPFQFQNFYSNSNSYNRGPLQPDLKPSDPFYE